MKKILLLFLIYFSLVPLAFGLQIVKLPLTGDLSDSKGTLAAGQIKRVSGATRINGGVLSTVRGNRINLIQQSENFNTWWNKGNVTITGGISDPDGGTDARYMKADATATESRDIFKSGLMSDNYFYLCSIFAKKADIDYLVLRSKSEAGTNVFTYFNLSTGAWGTAGHSTKGFTNEGDGWYRVWVLIDAQSGGTADTIYAYQSSADGSLSYAGTLGEGIYIYGAQLEKLEGPSAPPGAELIDDVNNRTFAAASGWTNNNIANYHEIGDLTITANAVDQFCILSTAEAPMTPYQAYLLEFDVANIVGSWTVENFSSGFTIGTIDANGTNKQIVFGYDHVGGSGGIRLTSVNTNSSMDFDNVSLKEVTFAGPLEPGTYTATAGADAVIPAEVRFEDGWLLLEGEGTNQCLHSRDLSNATWVKTTCTGAKSQTGLDGVASSASLLTATAANATALQTTILASTAKTFSVYIKRVTGTGTISITDNNGTNYTACSNISSTEFTQYKITRTQANPVVGFKVATDTDAIIVDCCQLEETAFSTSAVHTTTTPVTRTTEAGSSADNGVSWTITQPLKNILDDAEPVGGATDSQGTLLFDVRWECDESVIGGTYGLITTRDNMVSIAYYNAGEFVMSDATNSSERNHPAFSADDILYYASRWGDVDGNADNISAGFSDGTWVFDSTPGNYDGEFTLGTKLRLFYSNIHPIHIKNIRFYDEAFTQAEIAAGVDKGLLLWMLPLEIP